MLSSCRAGLEQTLRKCTARPYQCGRLDTRHHRCHPGEFARIQNNTMSVAQQQPVNVTVHGSFLSMSLSMTPFLSTSHLQACLQTFARSVCCDTPCPRSTRLCSLTYVYTLPSWSSHTLMPLLPPTTHAFYRSASCTTRQMTGSSHFSYPAPRYSWQEQQCTPLRASMTALTLILRTTRLSLRSDGCSRGSRGCKTRGRY